MPQLRPSDAYGELFTVDMTEAEETAWDDGWDDGYASGYQQALVDACGAVTALFVANVDDADAEETE